MCSARPLVRGSRTCAREAVRGGRSGSAPSYLHSAASPRETALTPVETFRFGRVRWPGHVRSRPHGRNLRRKPRPRLARAFAHDAASARARRRSNRSRLGEDPGEQFAVHRRGRGGRPKGTAHDRRTAQPLASRHSHQNRRDPRSFYRAVERARERGKSSQHCFRDASPHTTSSGERIRTAEVRRRISIGVYSHDAAREAVQVCVASGKM